MRALPASGSRMLSGTADKLAALRFFDFSNDFKNIFNRISFRKFIKKIGNLFNSFRLSRNYRTAFVEFGYTWFADLSKNRLPGFRYHTTAGNWS